MDDNLVRVSFSTCDCEWWTKYCGEYHEGVAMIPADVLAQYRVYFSPDDDWDDES